MGIREFQTTQRGLAHIHVNIVGPLPTPKRYRYLFTIIDRETRWPEAICIGSKTEESCMKALIDWTSRHGVPQYITSDRGAKFTSTLWSSPSANLGTKLIYTMAYNPEMNGMVERLHCSLKSALTARCQGRRFSKHEKVRDSSRHS
ncbi:uncharacterized protein YagA-like [Macrobrachium rosenbergii]|uniref:uncharacterized protein YagA-like n=1 Tax=Macrobrachium rosenbergii TaxID=79674 RepID=UPI0034D782DB